MASKYPVYGALPTITEMSQIQGDSGADTSQMPLGKAATKSMLKPMIRFISSKTSLVKLITSVSCAAAMALTTCLADEPIDLINLGIHDAFQAAPAWQAVAEVKAVEGQTEFKASGEGQIIINGQVKDKAIPYLVTKADFGDVRVELEFMVPKGSNAGIYLMGRYEVQILDSFGRERFGSGDLGGIYQRWDASLPKGKQGFGGIKPKINAAKAPGEWQTMEIIFRAPRFSFDGTKIKDATFEKVVVNGHLVQENASTTGPTRSAPLEGEAVTGPIAIQGDHGPVAIRSYKVTRLPYPEATRIKELDDYWAEVSRSVNTGDHVAYSATCHNSAIIISGNRKVSYPLKQALARWKKEFDDTLDGKRKSAVEFRFSHRYGDATTAHEAGALKYTWSTGDEAPQSELIGLEALLTKENNRWQILMEYQKGKITEAEWDKLATEAGNEASP